MPEPIKQGVKTASEGAAPDARNAGGAPLQAAPRGRHWLLRLWPLIAAQRRLLVLAIATSLAAVLLQVALPAMLGKTIDAIAAPAASGAATMFYASAGAFLLLGLVRGIAAHWARMLLYGLSFAVETGLRSRLFDHLVALPMTYFDKVQSGQIVSKSNADVRAIQSYLVFAPYVIMSSLSFLIAMSYMVSIHAGLALLAMLPLPGVLLLGMHLRRITYPLSWLIQSRMADVATVVDENINGQQVVKTFAREDDQIGLLRRSAGRLSWITNRLISRQSWYSALIEATAGLGQLFVLFYGGVLVIRGTLVLGDVVAFSLYALLMQIPFRMLGFVVVLGQRAAASAQRIFAVLDQSRARDDSTGLPTLEPEGCIDFDAVSFVYSAPDNAQAGLFEALSLHIDSGETVAVVGGVASGKTTLTRLLLGFYEPQRGSIHINGHDVRQITPGALRQHIAVAPTEPFLFAGTVEANIAIARPAATTQDVVDSATVALADEFVVNLPGGYQALLTERGANLSGGQRQRLGIARALLADAPILILDDATSALDNPTEDRIHAGISARRRGKTTIWITTRAATIAQADRVLFLHQGRCLQGTHDTLMRNEDYAQLLAQPPQSADTTPPPPREETQDEYRARIRAGLRLPVVGSSEIPGGV